MHGFCCFFLRCKCILSSQTLKNKLNLMRALVSIFTALLILISVYQLSFTWFVNRHEANMKEKAMQQTKRMYPAVKFSEGKNGSPIADDSARTYFNERYETL